MPRGRRDSAHLVTEAHRPRSEDINQRERRYLIMMGFRVVCFVVAVVVYSQGGGWLTVFPAAGAIVIPYFAVVIANAARPAAPSKGFRAYEPRLPVLYSPPDEEQPDGQAGPRPGGDDRPSQGSSFR